MSDAIITQVVNILGELAIMLIGVGGAWLTMKMSKIKNMEAINAAQQEVVSMAQITVGELSQTVVERLKADHEDGKLDKSEISQLGLDLVELTKAKLSEPTIKLLESAGVDLIALIRGAGENWINALKKGE